MWRRCTGCNKIKAFYEFRGHPKGSFGLQSRCLECEKLYYINNKEASRKRVKRYRKRHPERSKKSSYNSNKRLLQKDPDYFKNWRASNIDKCREAERRYAKNNPFKIAAKSARRRLKRLNQTVNLSDVEKYMVQVLYFESNELGSDYEVDHIVPVSKGGSDSPYNLQVISREENIKKSDKLNCRVNGLRIYWKAGELVRETNG